MYNKTRGRAKKEEGKKNQRLMHWCDSSLVHTWGVMVTVLLTSYISKYENIYHWKQKQSLMSSDV